MSEKVREQLLELPLELRAYINQQVSEFAPYCLPDSGVSVVVERETDDDKEEYYVTISLSGAGAEVHATAHADDIYDATKNAAQTLLEHLQTVQREMITEMMDSESQPTGTDDTGYH